MPDSVKELCSDGAVAVSHLREAARGSLGALRVTSDHAEGVHKGLCDRAICCRTMSHSECTHTFMLTSSEQVTPEICISEKVIFINSGNSVCIKTLPHSLAPRYLAVLSSALIFYIHHHPLAHHSSHIQGVHT